MITEHNPAHPTAPTSQSIIPDPDHPGRLIVTNYGASPGKSLRDHYRGQIMAGFCANPAVFASNPMNGWALVNGTVEQLVEYADHIAEAMLKVGAR